MSGDVSAVRRLVAANVNMDCTPVGVCDSISPYHTITSTPAGNVLCTLCIVYIMYVEVYMYTSLHVDPA